MTGYTVRFSADTIEVLIENDFFANKIHRPELLQALNDIDVELKYGNVSKNRYEQIKRILNEYDKQFSMDNSN